MIGNLPGLPFGVRDRANRMLLEYYALHGGEMSAACSKAFAEVMQAVNADDGEPPVSVVALNLEGPVPMVAMGYGDLDAAQNLTVESAGMFSNADAALPGWDTASKNLYAEQVTLLERSGRDIEGNAVIVYLEYDTPDLVTVLMPFSARTGAERLALEIDGVFATRAANVPLPNLAALAHSYGTTTMANALTLVTHKVQSFTMLASAGLDGQKIKDFSDLKVESAPDGSPAIYTTMASKDYVARIGSSLSGRLQPNPEVALKWPTIDGAHQFSSDGAGEFSPTTGHPLLAADGGGYMDEGTQALWNSAAVTMGAADLVVGELNVTSTPVWQVAMQVAHELGAM
ncbi:hypothetical protein G7067_04980 [Leucobacter insecticola]|uniref:DUF1023 domain-containing protein n=1 Tax=Leucobacter insecticola TaxID=2714934 RepID=A0A6G8FHT8_9MICO|nr:alpha/beta hydrolase [Leucobacter insecticola]QIM15918.1 hypothetical protein G7067_04980 [Leucobacter insecticola]